MRKGTQFSKLTKAYMKAKSQGTKLKEQSPKETAFEIFPDEILLKIFSYLNIKSLLSCASTCSHWERIANDNTLWKRFYCLHVTSRVKPKTEISIVEPASPLEAPGKYWKTRLIQKCKEIRNKRFLALDKTNPFTGVTNRMRELLEKLGVKFQLCLITRDEKTFYYLERKKKILDPCTVVQWYSLKEWPKVDEVSCIKVFSLVPIIYGADKKPLVNGPRQKTLLLDEKIVQKFSENSRVGSNDDVELYTTKKGFMAALWKGTKEFAYVCIGLHHHGLLKKCLFSSSKHIFSPAHEVKADDIDKRYGLHGYKFHLHLHGSEDVVLNDMFNCDDVTDSRVGDGSLIFVLKGNPIRINEFISSTSFQWKTDLFSGKVEKVAMLAGTMRDINSDVIWTFSAPAKLEQFSSSAVDFNSPNSAFRINYTDDTGRILIIFKPKYDDGYRVDSLVIEMKLSKINLWFGMSH